LGDEISILEHPRYFTPDDEAEELTVFIPDSLEDICDP
jgi:hypothetical protein